MALFSKDTLARRALISSVAALCALIFALLAFVAFKKRRRKWGGKQWGNGKFVKFDRDPLEDIEISQSILREQRKSMSLRRSTANGEEFIQQIRRHSSVTFKH